MICVVGNHRFADFPKTDFFIRKGSIIPKDEKAEERRKKLFESDDPGNCGCCGPIDREDF